MVRFMNPNQPTDQLLVVWCEDAADGFRLMRREPDGHLHAEHVDSRSALYDATVRLQSQLARSGWTPVGTDGVPSARRRAARSGHFHR